MGQMDLRLTVDPRIDAGKIETSTVEGENGPRVKMTSTAGKGQKATIYSRIADVVPGGEYSVSFQVRGDVPLQIIAKQYDLQGNERRFDLGKASLGKDAWTGFRKFFVMPADCNKICIWIFAWGQPGVFEVKDFLLNPGR